MTEAGAELPGARYRLAELLGEGGPGRVWRGRDELLERDVAVKEITFPAGMDAAERQVLALRALREARSAARLNHPGIVTIHDVITRDDMPVIVMEYVPGRSLAQVIAAEGRLSPARVAGLARAARHLLLACSGASPVGIGPSRGEILRRDRLLQCMLTTASVLGLLLSSGCAINKGTALAADFNRDWAGTPDVTNIHTAKNNTLPFAGSATGTLVLKDGTPADRVTELANSLRQYVAEHDTITGRITAGTVTFTVVADQERAGEVLAMWRSLTADDRLQTGDIRDASTKETGRWKIKLTVVNATGAITLFKDMIANDGQHRPLSDVTSLEVRTGRDVRPGISIRTDFNGTLPTEAIAAYEAVTARYTVVRASLTSDRAGIVVAKEAERAHAHELARAAAPSLGTALKVTSDSGPMTTAQG